MPGGSSCRSYVGQYSGEWNEQGLAGPGAANEVLLIVAGVAMWFARRASKVEEEAAYP